MFISECDQKIDSKRRTKLLGMFGTIVAPGPSQDPPKNTRAAALRSTEREQRDKDRKRDEAMTFEDQKLQFERERAELLKTRDKGYVYACRSF